MSSQSIPEFPVSGIRPTGGAKVNLDKDNRLENFLNPKKSGGFPGIPAGFPYHLTTKSRNSGRRRERIGLDPMNDKKTPFPSGCTRCFVWKRRFQVDARVVLFGNAALSLTGQPDDVLH